MLEGPEDGVGIVGYYDGVESRARARDRERRAHWDVAAPVRRERLQGRYLPRRVYPSDERPSVAIEPVARHRHGGTGPAGCNRGRALRPGHDSDGIRDRLAVQ